MKNYDSKELREYYKNRGLAIIGLNDSQGVNTTSTFFKEGLLEYIGRALSDDVLRPIVIDAFSLTLNKTEHIDSLLRANLSLEEIKLSQVYSVVSALEKVMQDIKMPKFLGKIGYVYKINYRVKPEDKDIFISDTLNTVEEPLVIYSSGVNNLMREVGSNPFAIKSQYKNRDKNPAYYYTLEKSSNPRVLVGVIDDIKKNFESIFGINEKSDIFALGAYIPKSLDCKEMNIFRELVLKYNELLEELCIQYGIDYVNTENIGKEFNKSSNNFHITSEGHNALANYILSKIYDKKILGSTNNRDREFSKIIITNKGPKEMELEYSKLFEQKCLEVIEETDEYVKKRLTDIANERSRESAIMQLVDKKSSRKK